MNRAELDLITDERRPGISAWPLWLPWFACVAILLTATGTDPDLWGHVRFGLDWLDARTLPAIDPYSFTQDRPWINHEWLSEALMAAAYRAGGSAGLVLLKVLIMGTAIAMLGARIQGATPIVRASIMMLAIVGALPLSATVRPQLWSLLGLVLLATFLNQERPTPRRILLAAALFAAWANLHGGWITGGGALALHAVIRSIRAPRDRTAWLVMGLLCLLATLLNPYGTGLWRFLAATVRASRPDIGEWQPFSSSEPPIMWVSIVAPTVLVLLLVRQRATRPPIETSAVVVLLIAAGLRVSRVAPLVCPAALVLLAPFVRSAWGRLGNWAAPSGAAAVIMLAPGIVGIAAAGPPVTRVMRCLPISADWAPDLVTGARLQGLSGRLWVTFDWGEYAIWHFGPALRVSVDGRRETVYSDDVVQWHRAVERGEPDALMRMVALQPEYVWLRSSKAKAHAWLLEHGYRIDVETPSAFVAVRADLPLLPPAATPLAPCFP